MVGIVERDEDVGHDGRTCGRTGNYALVDYLRSDKAVLSAGDFSVLSFFFSKTKSSLELAVRAEALAKKKSS